MRFFDQNRQIGSRCISALFVFKVGLQPRCIIFKAQAISGGCGGGCGGGEIARALNIMHRGCRPVFWTTSAEMQREPI